MSDSIKIQIVCPQERAMIGTLEVEPGEKVTAEMIREFMDGAPGWRDEAAEIRRGVSDGRYLMCPRCETTLMIGLAETDVDVVIGDNFVALVGSFEYPDPQHRSSER